MKTLILALFVVMAVSQAYALKCNCGGMKHCSSRVETCYGSDMVCGSVIITAGSNINHFKGCMSSRNCALLNRPGVSSASCCSRDLCN